MPEPKLRLAPFVPDLRAFGAEDQGDLLGTQGASSLDERAEEVSKDGESVLLRLPLPGTPDRHGRLSGAPRGAGTGHVFVRRYHAAPLGRILAARFTPPCSASLAAREWNLLCHLRAAGISTPEPMAVGSAGAGLFDRRSFVVTRELVGFLPGLRWFAEERDPGRRHRAARALGLTLRRLFLARVHLPRCSPEHVYIAADESPDCAVERATAGLAWRRRPEVAVTSVRGGRILRRVTGGRCEELLGGLLTRESRAVLTARERLVVFLAATADVVDRGERRAMLSRLSDGGAV